MMVYDRYYYSILPEVDRRIYRRLYNGIEKLKPEMTFINHPEQMHSLDQILLFIGLDNPHIFYVDFQSCTIIESAISKTIELTYWYSMEEIATLKWKVDHVLGKMISGITGKNAYEKELAVHDLLVNNVTYNVEAANHPRQYSPRASSIMGALFYKTATCDGISKIAKLLLNLCNIKCIVVHGTAGGSGEGHAWNIVKIEGEAYHLDITWDISESIPQHISYSYMNLTDSDILRDHTISMQHPACTSTRFNYFQRSGLLVCGEQDVARIATAAKIRGTNNLTFRYSGGDQAQFDELIRAAKQQLIEKASSDTPFQLRTRTNREQCVCSITLEQKMPGND